MTPQTPIPGRAQIRLFHLVLALGLTFMIGGSAVMVSFLDGPFLAGDPSVGIIRYVLPGVGLVAILVAQLGLRPRPAAGARERSHEAYWSDPRRLAAAIRYWAILEGGGTIATAGYLLSGGLLAVAAAGLALAFLALSGPGRLAGD